MKVSSRGDNVLKSKSETSNLEEDFREQAPNTEISKSDKPSISFSICPLPNALATPSSPASSKPSPPPSSPCGCDGCWSMVDCVGFE
ncbi:hypothetical protein ACET3Z_005381 [Daucus carota]